MGLYANFPLLTEGSVRFGFGSAEPFPRDSASVRFGKNPVRSYTKKIDKNRGKSKRKTNNFSINLKCDWKKDLPIDLAY